MPLKLESEGELWLRRRFNRLGSRRRNFSCDLLSRSCCRSRSWRSGPQSVPCGCEDFLAGRSNFLSGVVWEPWRFLII